MAGPQTTKDALMAELLGDVGLLMDRIEHASAALPAAADLAVQSILDEGTKAARNVEDACLKLRAELHSERQAAKQDLQGVVKAVVTAAGTVTDGAGRISRSAALLGAAAGALAGAVTAACFFAVFFL